MSAHSRRAGSQSLPHHPLPLNSAGLSPASQRSSRSRIRHGRSKEKGTPKFLTQAVPDIRRKFRELEEYESLHPNEDTQWKIDHSDEVTTRNRYSNIAAWDSNRIRLQVPTKYCDYINASPIVLKGRNGSVKRYIATQGPKEGPKEGPREGQFSHISRMIWQETSDVAVIVMLTKASELERDECFQYFPEKLDDIPWTVDGDEEFGDGFKATIKPLEKTKDKRSSCTAKNFVEGWGEGEDCGSK